MKVFGISQSNYKTPSFRALTKTDLAYKNKLVEGLRSSYGMNVSVNSLKSILSPDELKTLLKKFTPDDYSFGRPAKENTPLNEIFENIINGKYRVNLHLHTNNSDGKMTAEEFLEQSVDYANKAAQKGIDKLPPYTSAITDHNNIEGVKKIIALIVQNPEKYKNFKFAAGCEFMFFDDEHGLKKPTFEAVGLGFNPFDKELNESLSDENSIELINKIKEFGGVVSYAHPLRFCQGQEMSEDFVKYLLSIGINGIETNYQYMFRNMEQVIKQKDRIYEIAKENNLYETGGTDTHAKNIFHPKAEPILDMIW